MLSRLRKHLSFSNAIAVIALFAALGGAAYAAKTINGKSIKTNSIPIKKLKCPNGTTRHGSICYSPVQPASVGSPRRRPTASRSGFACRPTARHC